MTIAVFPLELANWIEGEDVGFHVGENLFVGRFDPDRGGTVIQDTPGPPFDFTKLTRDPTTKQITDHFRVHALDFRTRFAKYEDGYLDQWKLFLLMAGRGGATSGGAIMEFSSFKIHTVAVSATPAPIDADSDSEDDVDFEWLTRYEFTLLDTSTI